MCLILMAETLLHMPKNLHGAFGDHFRNREGSAPASTILHVYLSTIALQLTTHP